MITLGWIYLLPSETIKVIVKYHPKWMISCVLAGRHKNILAVKHDDYSDDIDECKIDIQIPSLIMAHTLHKPWIDYSKIETYFSIHALSPEESSDIYVLPYRLANVYSSGSICFGDVALDKKPTNLRQANNYFWGSSFNEDNCPFLDVHYRTCTTRNHDHYDEDRILDQVQGIKNLISTLKTLPQKNISTVGTLNASAVTYINNLQKNLDNLINAKSKCSCCLNECGCSCDCDLTDQFFEWLENYYQYLMGQKFVKSTNLFCGEKYFACPDPVSVFMTNNKEILNKIPSNLHRKDYQESFVIGTAHQLNDNWNIKFGDFELELPNQQLEVI